MHVDMQNYHFYKGSKLKKLVYIVIHKITQSVSVDVPHIKLLTQNILACILTHCFDRKNMIDQSTGVEAI